MTETSLGRRSVRRGQLAAARWCETLLLGLRESSARQPPGFCVPSSLSRITPFFASFLGSTSPLDMRKSERTTPIVSV